MAGNRSGAAGKGRWPDMRSLRWPPVGVEAKSSAVGEEPEAIPPFELVPEAGGGGPVAVAGCEAVAEPLMAAAPTAPSGTKKGGTMSAKVEAAPMGVAEGGCQGALIVEEVRALRRAVEALTKAIAGLGGAAGAATGGVRTAPGAGVVPVRSVSDHQARHEIQEYFLRHQGETLYPAQIADALNLPVLKVAELCETLAMRGQVNRNQGA